MAKTIYKSDKAAEKDLGTSWKLRNRKSIAKSQNDFAFISVFYFRLGVKGNTRSYKEDEATRAKSCSSISSLSAVLFCE